MARWRLQEGETCLVMRGTDDHDKPFELTLDRLWANDLQTELAEWLDE